MTLWVVKVFIRLTNEYFAELAALPLGFYENCITEFPGKGVEFILSYGLQKQILATPISLKVFSVTLNLKCMCVYMYPTTI